MEKLWIMIVLIACTFTGVIAGTVGFLEGQRVGETKIEKAAIEAGVAKQWCDADGTCHFEFKKHWIQID